MILVNITKKNIGKTVWTITDTSNNSKQMGKIDKNQVLNVPVQGLGPYTVDFNTDSGSRTTTLTGVSSPDACAVYWMDENKDLATATYPWGT